MPNVASVAVVVNSFQHEAFIDEAVRSALAQDWGGLRREIVVIDDGSRDGTLARARAHEPAVRCVSQPNMGQGAAFNRGLRETRGEIVCFLDGDDLWYPAKIASVVAAFNAHPDAAFVQHPLQAVDASGRALRRSCGTLPERVTLDDVLDGRSVLVGTTGICVRRSVLDLIAPVPEDLTTHADNYVSRHALMFAPGCSVPGTLGGLRVHGRNSFQGMNWNPDKLEGYFKIQDKLDGYFEAELRKRGRALTEAGKRAWRAERRAREILFHAWRGERLAALRSWSALRRELPASPLRTFKSATLLLAALWPAAYLTLQDWYGRFPRLPAARRALAGEAA